jgi:hypothetical protein
VANNSERITEIQNILRSGVTTGNVDGVQVTLDLNSLRKELRELLDKDNKNRGRRPVASSVKLSGF